MDLKTFGACSKRGLKGTYVAVEPFHLFRYLDEQAFRYNNRKKPMDDGLRFREAMNHVFGRRLTYEQLTSKDKIHQEEAGTWPS